jgi:hypothetical protein
MRLWSFHPRYLDTRGLVALWREALLAQKVLRGLTRGYRHHPQLLRFSAQPEPLKAIGAYLSAVWDEGSRRGYNFNREKIFNDTGAKKLPVPVGQVRHEWKLFLQKLCNRDRSAFYKTRGVTTPDIHPLFIKTRGGIAPWEKS